MRLRCDRVPHPVRFPVGAVLPSSMRSRPAARIARRCHHDAPPRSTAPHNHSLAALGALKALTIPHIPPSPTTQAEPESGMGIAFILYDGAMSYFPVKTARFNHMWGKICLQLLTFQPSSISASSPRISSIASFSRRIPSRSSSCWAVALTEMSANLDGNKMDVSSQDKAE